MNKLFLSVLSSMLLACILVMSSCSNDIEDELKGKWLRSDGAYTIEILDVNENGNLNAKYFNPDPINVGRAGWRVTNKELQIYVELQDKNYPGSFYELTFNKEKEILSGTYYQAVAQQTYEVFFNKVK